MSLPEAHTMEMKKVTVTDIGEITIRLNPGVKRISIRIKQGDGVVVTMPEGIPISRALKFVDQKKRWIIKHQQQFRQMEENKTFLNPESVHAICQYTLVTLQHASNHFRIRISDGTIAVFHPGNRDISDHRFQEVIRTGVIEALRVEAKRYLPGRVNELADRYGLAYNKVFIKNAQTRWGSCSTHKNINLNLHLMRLPSHLRDYVILHELTHTVHPNHGKAFWNFLDKLTGDARSLEKELKKYQIQRV
jgi:predicted metal-dependent hydrolase